MDKNKLLTYLVPVLAVIVLAESVMLISRFQNKITDVEPIKTEKKSQIVDEKIYKLAISSDKDSYQIGDQGKITVKMNGNTSKKIDAIDLYLKFDTSAFSVSNINSDSRLPKPAFSKVSTLKNMLVSNFLITEPEGLNLLAGEELNVVSFNFKVNKAGSFDFEISTGDEMKESATMIVENSTAKPLSFSSNKLSIKVTDK